MVTAQAPSASEKKLEATRVEVFSPSPAPEKPPAGEISASLIRG
jgi:hypothetical protein